MDPQIRSFWATRVGFLEQIPDATEKAAERQKILQQLEQEFVRIYGADRRAWEHLFQGTLSVANQEVKKYIQGKIDIIWRATIDMDKAFEVREENVAQLLRAFQYDLRDRFGNRHWKPFYHKIRDQIEGLRVATQDAYHNYLVKTVFANIVGSDEAGRQPNIEQYRKELKSQLVKQFGDALFGPKPWRPFYDLTLRHEASITEDVRKQIDDFAMKIAYASVRKNANNARRLEEVEALKVELLAALNTVVSERESMVKPFYQQAMAKVAAKVDEFNREMYTVGLAASLRPGVYKTLHGRALTSEEAETLSTRFAKDNAAKIMEIETRVFGPYATRRGGARCRV